MASSFFPPSGDALRAKGQVPSPSHRPTLATQFGDLDPFESPKSVRRSGRWSGRNIATPFDTMEHFPSDNVTEEEWFAHATEVIPPVLQPLKEEEHEDDDCLEAVKDSKLPAHAISCDRLEKVPHEKPKLMKRLSSLSSLVPGGMPKALSPKSSSQWSRMERDFEIEEKNEEAFFETAASAPTGGDSRNIRKRFSSLLRLEKSINT